MGDATAVDPKPTVGRIVHYVENVPNGTVDRAAIVLVVSEEDDCVCDLKVMTPTGDHIKHAVEAESPAEHEAATWHWPERV